MHRDKAFGKGRIKMNIGFWVFMLVCALITPAIMVITGIIFTKRPPKEINDLYGYHTKRSTQSPEAWKFANEYLGRLWLVAGLIMILLSIAVMLLFFGSDDDTTGIACTVIACIQPVVMILLMIPVEIALKQKFGNEKSG